MALRRSIEEEWEISFAEDMLKIGENVFLCPIIALHVFRFLQEHEEELHRLVDAEHSKVYNPNARTITALVA